jgi:hypothetical protein
LSIDLLKERLDFLPANIQTELELSVPHLEEVYLVIKFFSSSDIRHFAFERVSFIGEVYYWFKPTQEGRTIVDTDYPVLADNDNCHSGPSLYIFVRLQYSLPVVELFTRDIDRDLILDLYKSKYRFDNYKCTGIGKYVPGLYSIPFDTYSAPLRRPSTHRF